MCMLRERAREREREKKDDERVKYRIRKKKKNRIHFRFLENSILLAICFIHGASASSILLLINFKTLPKTEFIRSVVTFVILSLKMIINLNKEL